MADQQLVNSLTQIVMRDCYSFTIYNAAMRILPASDSSVIALFGEEASPAARHCVLNLLGRLLALNDPRLRNIHPAYASILVDFDPLLIPHEEIIALIQELINQGAVPNAPALRRIEIPVCYGGQFGPDLEDVAALCKLVPDEVIRVHSSPDYEVGFLGFLPGFGFLIGLPAQLAVAKMSAPRKIPAGSIGIAGLQSGIYPADYPGVWRVIGRTPLRMYNPEAEPPAFLQYGDTVHFIPIDAGQFESWPANGEQK